MVVLDMMARQLTGVTQEGHMRYVVGFVVGVVLAMVGQGLAQSLVGQAQDHGFYRQGSLNPYESPGYAFGGETRGTRPMEVPTPGEVPCGR